MNKLLEQAKSCRNLKFANGNYDKSHASMREVTALEYLILKFRKGAHSVLDDITTSVRNILEHGEPSFDVSYTWSYPILVACFTLIANTPDIAKCFTEEEWAKIDCLMEAFAYTAHLATCDENELRTGLGLSGNYHKNWAPNYRLANIVQVPLIAKYFGGSDAFDNLCIEYSHANFVEKLKTFGFENAYNTFTTPSYVTEDNLYVAGAEDILTTHCAVYVLDRAYGHLNVSDGGTSKGIVRPYTYKGLRAGDWRIAANVIENAHSGGKCVTKIIDAAYPEATGETPALGEDGMFLELNLSSNERYSAHYAKLDFVMEAAVVAAMVELGICTLENLPIALMKSGIKDLIWKLSEGFHNVNGTNPATVTREDAMFGYFFAKTIWNELVGE